MSIVTTNQTRFDIVEEESTFSASMILDDRGRGHITVCTDLGPVFSIDASKLDDLVKMLSTGIGLRQSVAPLGAVTVSDFL